MTPLQNTTCFPGQLTLHADRGSPMKAKATALLLADLGVTRSHNRPRPTTIHSPRATSKPSSISRASLNASAASRTPKASVAAFSIGANQQHHHAGIGLITRIRSTTARPMPFTPHVRTHSIARSATTQSASSTNHQHRLTNQPRPGSIHQRQRRTSKPKCRSRMYQSR